MRGATKIIIVCALWLCGAPALGQQQPVFPTPEDAARALAAAAKAGDPKSLIALLGGSGELVSSSDPIEARRNRDVFVAAMNERWSLADLDATRKEIIVGNEAWPFPVPLIKRAQGWAFDAEAGKEEVIARRIGRNELAAIGILRNYVKAQQLYAKTSHDGKPAGQYARRIASDPGRENGLYWPTAAGKPRSPLGEFMADAAEARVKTPFHGYYFRILEDFGLIAWPAQPDLTGVMTFIINNQDGAIYEKSLGAGSAAGIKRVNPDKTWTKVVTKQ